MVIGIGAAVLTTVARSETQPDAVPLPQYEKVSDVPQAEGSLFAVLRQPRTPADSLPADTLRVFQGDDPSRGLRFGGNLDLSRSIEVSGGKGWVIPGNGMLCIIAPDPALAYGSDDAWGVGCARDTSLHTTGVPIIFGEPGAGHLNVTLLVPDGSTVSERDSSGTVTEVPVNEDGVVAGKFSGGDVLTIKDASGSASDLRLPSAVPANVRVTDTEVQK